MSFEDLKDQLSSQFQSLSERVQENSTYNKIKDKYDNLSPRMQKVSLFAGALVVSLVILSIPMGKYSTSNESIETFEGHRDLIRKLFKVQREAAEVPNLPVAPGFEEVKNRLQDQFKSANLLPEQIAGIDAWTPQTQLFSEKHLASGWSVRLKKLNLRQVIDLGFQIQNISTSVKVKDMTMEANMQDPRYMDVIFKVVSLSVPEPIKEEPAPTESKKKTKKPSKETLDD